MFKHITYKHLTSKAKGGILLAAALCAASCSDFLSQYSKDMAIATTVADLEEVLIGEAYYRSKTIERGITADNCGFFNILDDDINIVANEDLIGSDNYNYTIKTTFGYFAWQQDVRFSYGNTSKTSDDATWNSLYHRIGVCNVILDEIELMPQETDAEKEAYFRVKGEAHFLRGQFYFIMANLYGKAYRPATCDQDLCVPLKLTPEVEYDKTKDTQFERATVKAIFDQVVADLEAASELLRISPQPAKRRLHRATWEAVDLLLSRVYLYMQDWPAAEAAARRVLETTHFDLAGLQSISPATPFLTGENREIVFSQGPNFVTPSGSLALGWSLTAMSSDYCVSRDLYDLYTEEDVRRDCYFQLNAATDSIALYRKYAREKVNNVSDALALRMAEVYLNLAEACALQGKEAEANAFLRHLREQRIIGYESPDFQGEELVAQVRLERRKELCFEGHRWFDLRRYAVCNPYPYAKDIYHTYAIYNNRQQFVGLNYYLLPAGDKAYTFSLPFTALEGDVEPMPDNERDERKPLELEEETKR